MRELFLTYARLLALLRAHCIRHGLSEFLPARDVKGYAHIPHQHFIVSAGNRETILPYQESLFNRLSTHFLSKPTFCVGPCYRNEGNDARHLNAFYQFSFELETSSLEVLISFVVECMEQISEAFGLNMGKPTVIDMRSSSHLTDTQITTLCNETQCAVLVLYKRKGIPPLLNALHNEDLEEAIELVLPGIGETLDGGVRDPSILKLLYGVTPTIDTSGATFGLERLAAFILKYTNIKDASLS